MALARRRSDRFHWRDRRVEIRELLNRAEFVEKFLPLLAGNITGVIPRTPRHGKTFAIAIAPGLEAHANAVFPESLRARSSASISFSLMLVAQCGRNS